MLDSLAPARRRLVLILVALVGLAVVVVAAIVVVRQVGGAEADQSELGPVLVVPGYGGRVASVEPIADALREGGRDVTVVQPTDGGTGDLAVQARRLGTIADDAMRRSDADSVDVVGYSAGGVVARLWARDDGGSQVARRILTIGSPHHGTDVAALAVAVAGSCPQACEQLTPDSDLLRRLNAGDETPAGPAWITLRSTGDRVVTPTDSAVLDGALDIEVQQLCPDSSAGHGDLPSNPVVLATIARSLGRAAPSIPTDVECG